MRMTTIPKESTTPRCNKLFLPENLTMIEREDQPQLKMVINYVLLDGLYLSTMTMVDLSAKLVKGLQEVAIAIL
jgi:hypothetical protein